MRVLRGGLSRMSARNVTLLPEPLSPKMHSVSRGARSKSTPSRHDGAVARHEPDGEVAHMDERLGHAAIAGAWL